MAALVPEQDVADFLAVAGVGLTLGTNLFTGAVLPANQDGLGGGIPSKCVFVTSVGGRAPLPYMGRKGAVPSVYFHGIQVSTRSNPSEQADGVALARAIRDELQRAEIPNYFFCLVNESEPLYLGADAKNCHRWSTNLDLRSAVTP